MAELTIKEKLLKKTRVGWRIGISMTVILVITMAFFEFITYLNIERFQGNPAGFIKIHTIHTLITIGILLFVTIYLLARYVLKPVYKLLLAIEEMKSGKLVTALEIKSNDEFELLAEEFNEMGFKLREQVQQKVREEKYTSAIAVAKRVANTLSEPCSSIRTNAKLLKEIARDNPQVANLSDIILKDVHKIESELNELSKMEIPEVLK